MINHPQGPCEWVDGDLEVLWVELKTDIETDIHLKVGCSNLDPVRDWAIYPSMVSISMVS